MDTDKKDRREALIASILPMAVIFLVWLAYMIYHNKWYIFKEDWYMSITMIFGSFVAGASSEGGGAVAFPVMTLLYHIPPAVARNFSLAIQSIGMTSAAYVIFRKRILIEKNYLFYASIGGVFGVVFGTYFIVPHIKPAYAKMMFVTFWLSFAIILYYINHIKNRKVVDTLEHIGISDKIAMVVVGFLGSNLTAIFGSGIDIFTFAYMTMKYQLSEKVATPTSVVLMGFNSVVGFLLHYFVIQDFQPEAFNFWLACIPVVIVGAPLGAFFISTQTRKFVIYFLYTVIVAQFIGAVYILKPMGELLAFTVAVFVGGISFFFIFARKRVLPALEPNEPQGNTENQ
ncbi:MAG: sulfite exporter TauE/SafE family protein [Candidatus Hydrogenedentota bacterium]|nr:MAG: sulfite exporter TauE/SafE family protein [Candidatus Hydrogenedentota bacterium]